MILTRTSPRFSAPYFLAGVASRLIAERRREDNALALMLQAGPMTLTRPRSRKDGLHTLGKNAAGYAWRSTLEALVQQGEATRSAVWPWAFWPTPRGLIRGAAELRRRREGLPNA